MTITSVQVMNMQVCECIQYTNDAINEGRNFFNIHGKNRIRHLNKRVSQFQRFTLFSGCGMSSTRNSVYDGLRRSLLAIIEDCSSSKTENSCTNEDKL